MVLFQSVLFLVLGLALLIATYRSLASGFLPFGSNGFKGRLEIHRSERPFFYWTIFAAYAVAGALLAGFSIALLLGFAHPLPLR